MNYAWGGNGGANGIDCSGLIQQAYKQIGVNLPRVSWDQIKMGPRISADQAKPGDLIAWGDGGHIAMSLGNNQVIVAPRAGTQVQIRSLGNSWDQSQGYYGVSMQQYLK